MVTKKKASKSPAKAADKSPLKSSSPKPNAKPANESVIIPFAPFPDFSQNTNQTMETLMNSQKNQFEKFSSEGAEQARQVSDNMMKSSTLFMKGMEQLMKTCMSMAQDSAEKNSEAMKQLMACKTINDFTEAQNKLAQQNFDDMMQNATKLSEICIKVCTEACDPINEQLSKAIKKASEQMAA